MDQLFGDATTAFPTPSVRAAETGSLMGGASSPVPSMDLRRGVLGASSGGYGNLNGFGPSSAIPGLDIDPPRVKIVDGKPQYSTPEPDDNDSPAEGVGGWISRMVKRSKDDGSVRSGKSGNGSSRYKPLDQDEE